MCSFSVPGLVDWALISLQLILSSSMTQTGLVGEEWSGNVFKSCYLASIGVCVCVCVCACACTCTLCPLLSILLSLVLQNPQADLQAQDRCHRIGQTKPVVVYRFVTANTIDQQVVETACSKRKLEQMVIHKGETTSKFMRLESPLFCCYLYCSVSPILLLLVGLFKGHNKKSESMTVEHLKTLLESSGHERVFDSGSTDVGLSEESLAALLDRSFSAMCDSVGTLAAKAMVTATKHRNLFKVVAEEEEGQPTLGSVNAAER